MSKDNYETWKGLTPAEKLVQKTCRFTCSWMYAFNRPTFLAAVELANRVLTLERKLRHHRGSV